VLRLNWLDAKDDAAGLISPVDTKVGRTSQWSGNAIRRGA
jgi:hypothetical protein